jgi:uncharacterized membrane protein
MKREWLVPAGLIALSIVPVIAGGVRLSEIATGAEPTPQNARFLAMPLPVVLHIVSVTIYCVLGAFQFVPSLRRTRPGWHRASGRILVPMGLLAASTGLWMTLAYPWANLDGEAVFAMRLLVGSAMFLFVCIAFLAIRRRNVMRHRAFMVRAYALGTGAGTQVFTHVPYFLVSDMQGETGRAICMAAGWLINIAVAEWIIRRPAAQSARPLVTQPQSA